MNGRKAFFCSAACILSVAGLLKIISVSGEARGLSLLDPLLQLTNRQVFLIVGIFEVALAVCLIIGRNSTLQLLSLAWFSTVLVAYRVIIWWKGIVRPCGCLGAASDWFPWLSKHQDRLMQFALMYLFIGSYFLLVKSMKSIEMRANSQK